MIDISAFEGRQEIDEGFILRANEEVTSYIKDFIKNQNDKTVLRNDLCLYQPCNGFSRQST